MENLYTTHITSIVKNKYILLILFLSESETNLINAMKYTKGRRRPRLMWVAKIPSKKMFLAYTIENPNKTERGYEKYPTQRGKERPKNK